METIKTTTATILVRGVTQQSQSALLNATSVNDANQREVITRITRDGHNSYVFKSLYDGYNGRAPENTSLKQTSS